MCLYHYIYFSSCQHGELTLITYCDTAKALGIPERDNRSRRSHNPAIDNRSANSLSPPPPTSSTANTHSASHLHRQQPQHCNMTTLSPSKARSMHGYDTVGIKDRHYSPQKDSHIPRSALPERTIPDDTSHTASLTAVQALEAFSGHTPHENTVLLCKSRNYPDAHDVADPALSAYNACDSDIEATQDASESSIDIITERNVTTYGDVRSASPRKPLPAQWLHPSTSPKTKTAQQEGARENLKGPSCGSPTNVGTVRSTRSSLGITGLSTTKATFLTKEALDAVNASITSPTLCHTLTKLQRSPKKKPWNSPTVSPKTESPRRSTGTSARPSPPRTVSFADHVTAEHRRAPSSAASTGATTFHTAYGSPVRSSICSQSSFSSTEELFNQNKPDHLDSHANMVVQKSKEQLSSRRLTRTSGSTAGLQVRPSRPELSISIPPRDTTVGPDETPGSAITSATCSSGCASSDLEPLQKPNTFASPLQPSRIPRKSMSRGSTARAPTLSSSLKQTKSTQTLKSPKTSKSAADPIRMPAHKTHTTKSLRHVRTLDSAGSTPITTKGTRRCAASIPTGVVGVSRPAEKDSSGVNDGDHFATRTASRATSTSTVRAHKTEHSPVIHSNNTNDEYDDSAASATTSDKGTQSSSPPHDQRAPTLCRRTTPSYVPVHSASISDLRATATEFIPAQDTGSRSQADVAASVTLPVLPDLYALDAYGIPWYYHMYPVPWLFPPIYTKGRSRSPKKLRPRKQRLPLDNSHQDQKRAAPSLSIGILTNSAGLNACNPQEAINKIRGRSSEGAVNSGDAPIPASANFGKLSDDPFASQFDQIAHQAAIQTSGNNACPPEGDLTTIHNVSSHDMSQHPILPEYFPSLPRRRNQRNQCNGLYGGRGNVGVPLHATAPFPTPVPPMGRPAEVRVESTVGARACGIIEIEEALEHGGGQSCNTCEPDH